MVINRFAVFLISYDQVYSYYFLVLFSKVFSNKIFILACMAKDKNKIKKYDQEATSWTSIHCESEMEKQDLQAGESQ